MSRPRLLGARRFPPGCSPTTPADSSPRIPSSPSPSSRLASHWERVNSGESPRCLAELTSAHLFGATFNSHVYMGRTKAKPNYILALKCIKKKKIRALDDGKQFRREVEIQSHLLHPHLLRLYGYFHDEEQVYLMLEYAGGGELFRKLQKARDGRFDEPTAAKVSSSLAPCFLRRLTTFFTSTLLRSRKV